MNAIHYEATKDIYAKNGVVVSAHPLASEAGLSILKMGGNAVDAAIATHLALAVVYPRAGNLGGGGFAVIHLKGHKNIALNYREKAPGKSFRDMYLDKNGNPLIDQVRNGHRACGIPGTVAGIFELYKYATLPFPKLIEPAILLAQDGFALTKRQADSLNEHQNNFKKYNSILPAFFNEKSWRKGDVLIQKDLAATLSRIRDNGKKEFYEGKTADLIVEEMKRGNGIITMEDLKNYQVIETIPIELSYRGTKVLTMPLPSSGGIILDQMLKLSAMFHLEKMQFQTCESVNLMTEIERRCYADRAEHLGDSEFHKVPLKALVDENYLRNRMKDYTPGVAGKSQNIKAGHIQELEETTHFNVLDCEGNAVSVTTTINGGYGSQVVVGHAGFFLNNEMDDFSIKPGVPNMFGALGGKANEIVPNKRMLSSMTPTIILKNNKPWLILGTPGGTTIITSIYQTIVNIIDFGMTPHDAVNRPKFHHQFMPDVIYLENEFDKNTRKELEAIGYKTKLRESIGRTEVIMVNEDGSLTGVADHRGDDSVAGY